MEYTFSDKSRIANKLIIAKSKKYENGRMYAEYLPLLFFIYSYIIYFEKSL